MNLTDKLTKCNDNLTVNIYDNGFMVEVGGRDEEDNWKTAKVMCQTLDEVFAVITQASEMEKE
jgi:TATA-box binding protein (TBP) (component of TFIID and TFIIIB)